jgi:hypothetical protein
MRLKSLAAEAARSDKPTRSSVVNGVAILSQPQPRTVCPLTGCYVP